MIGGLASLGLPGLSNFAAEALIFLGSYSVEQVLFGWLHFRVLAILAILGVVITAIYVLRVVQKVFFGPRNSRWDHLTDAHGVEMVPIVVLCGVLVLFGIFPSLLVDPINVGVGPLVAKITAAAEIGGIF